ncbi:hypothetical protein J3R83DRAFT_4846 [Lanmaoa asiatica]|nr:hypothetical protein J3R83DRAFT_4846 [Lanmaoa asiatica]
MSGPATNEQSAVRQDPEFNFWDFVSCAVCHLPFSPADRGPPPVPFWITECGHVLCNSHLNPNQSCAKCGDQGIQLMPLQRNIDPPMSDWFRLLPHAIDGMANAVKFQQESLAALVRHYRNQCLHLSSTCDRLRNERRSLRKDVEALRKELHLCRSRGFVTDQSREPSAHLNHNGKRPMAEIRGIKTNSSPRSIPTPVGPLRLTLPRGEHPTFSRQEPSGQEFANTVDIPGSSRFAEQYAYHGEDNSRVRPPQHTDEQQSASLRQPRLLDMDHGMMAPPPPPNQGKRFKPATGQVYSHTDQRMEVSTSQNLGTQRITKISESMGPLPTPQRPFSAVLRTPSRVPTQNATLQSSLQTNRFIPSSSHGRAFSGPTLAVTSTTVTPVGNVGKASGGNRMPFMPQGSNGFG